MKEIWSQISIDGQAYVKWKTCMEYKNITKYW